MKIRIRIVLLVFTVFLFVNCSEEKITPEVELNLIFPVNEENIPIEDVDFLWEFTSDFDGRLSLYRDSLKGERVLTRLVGENNYLVPELDPSTHYFWEIDYHGTKEWSDFTTVNPFTNLEGSFDVEMIYEFATPIEHETSTRIVTYHFTPNDLGVNLSKDNNKTIRNFIFAGKSEDGNEYIYDAFNDFHNPNEDYFLYINLELRRVRIHYYYETNASGTKDNGEFFY